jgi:hypothetical protein
MDVIVSLKSIKKIDTYYKMAMVCLGEPEILKPTNLTNLKQSKNRKTSTTTKQMTTIVCDEPNNTIDEPSKFPQNWI